jgi:hypothetical protein
MKQIRNCFDLVNYDAVVVDRFSDCGCCNDCCCHCRRLDCEALDRNRHVHPHDETAVEDVVQRHDRQHEVDLPEQDCCHWLVLQVVVHLDDVQEVAVHLQTLVVPLPLFETLLAPLDS